jgi:hypothetical protein
MIVPGEEELGPQQKCSVCGDWWPLDGEFFHPSKDRPCGFMARCRACHSETYVRRTVRYSTPLSRERKNVYNREWMRRKRTAA